MEVEFTQHTQQSHSFNTPTCSTGNFLCTVITSSVKKSSVRKLDSPWLWKLSVTCQRVYTCCELTHRFYPLCFHVLVLHSCTIFTILKLLNGGQTFTIIPVQFTSLRSFFYSTYDHHNIHTGSATYKHSLKLGNKWC